MSLKRVDGKHVKDIKVSSVQGNEWTCEIVSAHNKTVDEKPVQYGIVGQFKLTDCPSGATPEQATILVQGLFGKGTYHLEGTSEASLLTVTDVMNPATSTSTAIVWDEVCSDIVSKASKGAKTAAQVTKYVEGLEGRKRGMYIKSLRDVLPALDKHLNAQRKRESKSIDSLLDF